jgi:hypothetical protein
MIFSRIICSEVIFIKKGKSYHPALAALGHPSFPITIGIRRGNLPDIYFVKTIEPWKLFLIDKKKDQELPWPYPSLTKTI